MNKIIKSYLCLIRKLLPANQKTGVIGLDISPSVCRAIHTLSNQADSAIIDCAEQPIEKDEKSALEKLFSSLTRFEKPSQVIVSAGGKGTLIRYIDMPRMSAKDLKKAFAIEAEKYLPFPKDTIYTDCHILNPGSNDKKMNVLVAAVKKEIIDGRLKLLRDAGIEPAAVTLAPVAVANAFHMVPPPMAQTGKKVLAAVIDFGEASSNLMILSDGQPMFSRDIFIGLSDIARRIVNVSGISHEDARAAIFSSELRSDTVQKTIEAVIQSLVSELRLSFDYFVTEKNLPIQQIYLIGEGTVMPGLETFFAHSLDIPLMVWNPFEVLAAGKPITHEKLKSGGREFITALGLSLSANDQS